MKKDEIDRRVREALNAVGLDPDIVMDRRPHQFSGGQRQRIGIARGDGFGLTIHGPNDRYINDAKICEAIGQMLSAQGIPTKVVTMPKNVFFKRASKGAKGGLPYCIWIKSGWSCER